MTELRLTIPGRAQQRGSKIATLIPRRGGGYATNAAGRPIVVARDANANSKDWMALVKLVASQAYRGTLIESPVELVACYYFSRPKSHYKSGVIRGDAPTQHAQSPDLAKLTRCLEDALTGVVWLDDRLVWSHVCHREWTTDAPRTDVLIKWKT